LIVGDGNHYENEHNVLLFIANSIRMEVWIDKKAGGLIRTEMVGKDG
jgi:hypothetical protein